MLATPQSLHTKPYTVIQTLNQSEAAGVPAELNPKPKPWISLKQLAFPLILSADYSHNCIPLIFSYSGKFIFFLFFFIFFVVRRLLAQLHPSHLLLFW